MTTHCRGCVLRAIREPMTGFEPVTSSLPRKCSTTELHWQNLFRAEDEAQTRDPQLGRLMLYQLSYFRIDSYRKPFRRNLTSHSEVCGRGWIRTTEGESQQIYSLPHLATLEYAQLNFIASLHADASD